MRRIYKTLLALSLGIAIPVSMQAGDDALVKEGAKIFKTKNLGNCISCHAVNGVKLDGPGSLGPKLVGLSAWPKEALHDKIYDPYTTNPVSAMPAFGKNGWLDEHQIEALVAYLKTIK